MSTYTVVGSGPEVPCSQSGHRHSYHVTFRERRPANTLHLIIALLNESCVLLSGTDVRWTRVCHLQADGQVDPAAERRADGARMKAEVFEELREGVGQ